ncbi:hypothetical protein, partial [Vibrio caribbeanicus]|uniref:hypothetical protein n=1 Tax=Vibrio caribbeanicus TaxID=701175 RepID=UPI0030DC9FAE
MFKKSPLVLALLFSAAGANAVPSHKVCSNESGNARNTSNIYFSDDCNYAYVGLPNYGKATLNGYTSMNLDQCQNYDQINDTLKVIIESAQRNTRRIAEFTNELEEVQQKINELEEERVGFELEAEDLEEQIAHIEENVLPPLVQDKRDKRKILLECRDEAKDMGMDVREYCSESYQAYRDANRLYRDQNKVIYSLLDSKTRASSRESMLSHKITRLRRDRSSLEELLISVKNRVNDLLKDVQESKQYYFRIYGATASLLFTTDVDSYINEKR